MVTTRLAPAAAAGKSEIARGMSISLSRQYREEGLVEFFMRFILHPMAGSFDDCERGLGLKVAKERAPRLDEGISGGIKFAPDTGKPCRYARQDPRQTVAASKLP